MLVAKIPTSAAEMVLTLELNFERDKTGDVGKFHSTYIIHIFPSHFRYKDRLAMGCLTFSTQTGTQHLMAVMLIIY